VAGCGYADAGPQARAQATAESFVETCTRGYPDRAVEMLANGLQPAFVAAGASACERLLGVSGAARVQSVRLHGARATATVAGTGGRQSDFDLGFFEDSWLVQGPARRLEETR
jgi:hypothetical protein